MRNLVLTESDIAKIERDEKEMSEGKTIIGKAYHFPFYYHLMNTASEEIKNKVRKAVSRF